MIELYDTWVGGWMSSGAAGFYRTLVATNRVGGWVGGCLCAVASLSLYSSIHALTFTDCLPERLKEGKEGKGGGGCT